MLRKIILAVALTAGTVGVATEADASPPAQARQHSERARATVRHRQRAHGNHHRSFRNRHRARRPVHQFRHRGSHARVVRHQSR
jgi:hypothetical protein